MKEDVLLEQIIIRRKTTRSFSGEYPAKADIEAVIKAGYYAPYAFIGTPPHGRKGLRKFFVLEKNSPVRNRTHAILAADALEAAGCTGTEAQRKMMEEDEKKLGYRLPAEVYRQIHMLSRHMADSRGHFLHFKEVPYFIIMAEKERMSPASSIIRQSLAHCMQNMWLAATAKNLAFQPISRVGKLGGHKEFCSMLGIRPHEYQLDGCVIGIPAKERARCVTPFDAGESIVWL